MKQTVWFKGQRFISHNRFRPIKGPPQGDINHDKYCITIWENYKYITSMKVILPQFDISKV